MNKSYFHVETRQQTPAGKTLLIISRWFYYLLLTNNNNENSFQNASSLILKAFSYFSYKRSKKELKHRGCHKINKNLVSCNGVSLQKP